MKKHSISYRVDILSQPHALCRTSADIRIVYVVDGKCAVSLSGERMQLGKSDILLINSNEHAQVEAAENMLAAVISIEYYQLCSMLNMSSVRFFLTTAETGQKYSALKSQIQDLLLTYMSEDRMSGYKELGTLSLLIYTLTTNFLIVSTASGGRDNKDARVARILNYIHGNYSAELSLNAVAEQLFLSPSSVSRMFQKAMGQGFNSYIRQLRLEHVKLELQETEHPITRIAIDNGFSTPSALNKAFKAEFGSTPTEYREAHARTDRNPLSAQMDREKALQILQADQRLRISELGQQITVHADIGRMAPWKKWENKLLNVGPAHLLSSANMQRQVLFLANTLEVEYLRIWNPFSAKMMICGGKKGEYNFSFLDEILDFCVDNRLKLFLDLARRKENAMASEKQEIYSSEEPTEFESAEEWLGLLDSFLAHIRRRYKTRQYSASRFKKP